MERFYYILLIETGLGLTITANNIANIIVSFGFPIFNKAVGSSIVFFVFAGICLFGTIFLFFCLPESSGDLDKNEINEIVSNKPEGVKTILPEKRNEIETIPNVA